MTSHGVLVHARSVSGVGREQACELFRLPGVDASFSAHASDDSSVFVQRLDESGASGMQSVCVIDTRTRPLPNTPTQPQGPVRLLTWLASSASVLAVAHETLLQLVSLAPVAAAVAAAPLAAPAGHTHRFIAQLTTSARVLAVAAGPSLRCVLVATADGRCAGYDASAALLRASREAAAPLALGEAWACQLPSAHSLLAVCPVTERLAASAAPGMAALAVWRLPCPDADSADAVPAVEWVRSPCALTSVSFRPDTRLARRHGARGQGCPPAVLMAACADGCIRIWADVDLSATLPDSAAGAKGTAEIARRAMCLAQVLSPPGPQTGAPLCASWADPAQVVSNADTCSQHRVAWLVATRAVAQSGAAAATASSRFDDAAAERADDVLAWAVFVSAPQGPDANENSSSAGATAPAGGALGSSAVCCVPRVRAALWGHDSHQLSWAHAAAAPTQRRLQLAAAAVHEGAPVLHLAHVALRGDGGAEARSALVDLVDVAEGPAPDGLGGWQRLLALHTVPPRPLAPHVPHMSSLLVHASEPLAVTLGATSGVQLWQAQPLSPLYLDARAAAALPSPAAAAAWLPAHDGAAELAVVASGALHIVRVHAAPPDAMALDVAALASSIDVETVAITELPASMHDGALRLCAVHNSAHVAIVVHSTDGDHGVSVVAYGRGTGTLQRAPAAATALGDGWAALNGVQGREDMLVAAAGAQQPRISLFVASGGTFVSCGGCGRAEGGTCSGAQHASVHADALAMCAASVTGGVAPCLTIWGLQESGEGFLAARALTRTLAAGPAHVRCLPLHGGRSAVAVATPHDVTLFAAVARAAWVPLATFDVPGVPHSLAAGQNAIFVGLPGQIIALKPSLQTPSGPVPLQVLASAAQGPLHLWHPANIAALLLCGAHTHALALLRQLIAVLRGRAERPLLAVAAGAAGAACAPVRDIAAGVLLACRHLQPAEQPRAVAQAQAPAAPKAMKLSDILGSKRPAAAPLRASTGQQSQGGVASGQLDMCAFGMSAPQQAAPIADNAMQSGQVDMSAFGMGAPQQSAAAAPSALQSGQIDMGAFGMGAPQQNASAAPTALQSGQLDMSAIGASTRAQPAPLAQTAVQQDALQSGQIDMSTFGMAPSASTISQQSTAGTHAPTREAAKAAHITQSAADSAMATGQLDMSAFAFGGPPQPQPPHAASSSAMDTGQLDAGAFGAAPQRSTGSVPQSALETGQLDMSAFGMQGHSSALASSHVDTYAFAASQQDSAMSTSTANPLASGQIDMAAFGGAQHQRSTAQSADRSSGAQQGARGPVAEGVETCDRQGAAFGDATPAFAPPADGVRRDERMRRAGAVLLASCAPSATEGVLSAAPRDRCADRETEARAPRVPSRCSSLGISDELRDASGPPGVVLDRVAASQGASHIDEQPCALDTCDGCWSFSKSGRPVGEGASPRHGGVLPERRGALSILQTDDAAQAAAAALESLSRQELHTCSGAELLDRDAMKALMESAEAPAAADKRKRAAPPACVALGLAPETTRLLVALAASICSAEGRAGQLAAQVQALDLPGRRMVSAARLGAALLEFEWAEDAAEAAAVAGVGEREGWGAGQHRRKTVMSGAALQLLSKLRGGGAAAAESSEMASGALSQALPDTQTAAPEATEAHWSALGLLDTLQPAGVLWAFDCGQHAALLDTLLACMPEREPESAAGGAQPAAGTSEAFSTMLRGSSGKAAPNAWTWQNLRRLGAVLWLREAAAAAVIAERMARATFAAQRDPYAVALYYCALGKRSVVAGLLRAAGDARVATFFNRDFSQPDARAAAAKNAHKLLSQHRYLLAAAFFLCAGDVDAATATCVDRLHDAQLALFVCRLLDSCGPGGHTDALLQQLLSRDDLPRDSLARILLQRAGAAPPLLDTHALRVLTAAPAATGGDSESVAVVKAAAAPLLSADWTLHTVLESTRCSGRAPERCPPCGVGGVAMIGNALQAAASAARGAAAQGACVAAMRAALLASLSSFALRHCAGSGGSAAAAQATHEAASAHTRAAVAAVAVASSTARPLRLEHAEKLLVHGGSPAELRAAAHRVASDVHNACTVASAASAGGALLEAICGDEGERAALEADGLLPRSATVHTDITAISACFHALRDAAATAGGADEVPVDTLREQRELGSIRRLPSGGAPADAQGGALLDAASSWSIAAVGEKDAQAVTCSNDPCSTAPDLAIATKRHGITFVGTMGQAAAARPSARNARYTQLYDEIVEEWHGAPGPATLLPRFTSCAAALHPHAAQRAQRAALVSPAAGACVAQTLAAHPTQAAVLSGSAPGYLHCWRLADRALKATYAPLPYSKNLVTAGPGGTAGAVPHPQQVAHWGYATDIAFDATGTRFAAIGKGGWVCLWRYDAQWADTPHGRVGCCDWAHRCVDKHGDAVAFVGGRATLLLVGGRSAGSLDLTVWDVLLPQQRACVAAAPDAQLVNDVIVAPDEVTVLVATKRSGVLALDLRKLGAARIDGGADVLRSERGRGVMWAAPRAHEGAATCAAACPAWCAPGGAALGATGGRDGDVVLWDLKTGAQRQALPQLHWTHARGLFGFGASEERVGCKIKSIGFQAGGMVSAGHATAVLHTPWHRLAGR